MQSSSALNFSSTPDLVVGRVRREAGRKPRLQRGRLLAIAGVVLVGIGLAVLGWKWRAYFDRESDGEEDPVRVATLNNFRFAWPDRPWKRDRDLELKMRANIALRSPERNNCMALYFNDYKTRLPGEAEMLDVALDRLRSYLRGLEWQRKPEEKVQLGGQPAVLLEFQGEDPEHVQMNGECYLLGFRGYAYWFFTWGPLGDRELVSPAWDELRERFSLLDGRKGWTEKPRETAPVMGKKARYQLRYVSELWSPQPTPQDYDPLADLVLRGDEPDPDRRKSARKSARLEVLLLPKRNDLAAAVAAARAYLQQREERAYPKTNLEVMKDKNGADLDRARDFDGQRGQLSQFHVQNTEDLEHFVVLAVVPRPEGVLVLVGDCLWDRHDFWDREFLTLIESLNFAAR